jgi:lambda repressor-like predicted transcriptional regulator
VAEYQAGHLMKEIAARHGVHRVTVSEVLDRTGTRKRPKSMSASQIDLAARLYSSGLSLASVGAQLGFNATTVRTMLMRRGVAMRDSHGRER